MIAKPRAWRDSAGIRKLKVGAASFGQRTRVTSCPSAASVPIRGSCCEVQLVSNFAEDPYVTPYFWQRGDALSLENIFEDIVLQDYVINECGHWFCGLREFVHDPQAPFPHVLPVIGGKTWEEGIDVQRISSVFQPFLDQAAGAFVLSSDIDLPSADSIDPAIGQRLERLPEIKWEREQRRKEPQQSDRFISSTYAKWQNPWTGRDRSCAWFGALDDLGYDILMRIHSVFNGLGLPTLTGAEVYGTIEPKTHDLAVIALPPDWWEKFIKVDFEGGILYAGTYGNPPRWEPRFSDIIVGNRQWLRGVDLAIAGKRPKVRVAKIGDPPKQTDTVHLKKNGGDLIGEREEQEPWRKPSNRERIIAAHNALREEGYKPRNTAELARRIKAIIGYDRDADYIARELRALSKDGRIELLK